MRFGSNGYALAYEVDTDHPEGELKYSHILKFPGHLSKFMIKYDEDSKCYFSIVDRIYDKEKSSARNLLSLLVSRDLRNWSIVTDILDYRDSDYLKVGFQYADFIIEGKDILFLCRTAMNNAQSYHNSNYSTFHWIKDFRKLLPSAFFPE